MEDGEGGRECLARRRQQGWVQVGREDQRGGGEGVGGGEGAGGEGDGGGGQEEGGVREGMLVSKESRCNDGSKSDGAGLKTLNEGCPEGSKDGAEGGRRRGGGGVGGNEGLEAVKETRAMRIG